jgi:hypothetical protein
MLLTRQLTISFITHVNTPTHWQIIPHAETIFFFKVGPRTVLFLEYRTFFSCQNIMNEEGRKVQELKKKIKNSVFTKQIIPHAKILFCSKLNLYHSQR